jgi:hypothetical protein
MNEGDMFCKKYDKGETFLLLNSKRKGLNGLI